MNITLQKLLKLNTYLVSFLIYLLIFSVIDPVYSLTFAILFIFALYRDFFRYIHIPRIAINTIAIFLLLVMFFRLDMSNLVLPILETLLILLSFKLLEDKSFRDYMQIYLIITVIFSGYSLLSISILFLVYILIYIFLLNFSIIILTYYTEDNDINLTFKQLKAILIKSSIIPLLSIPLTFVLFLFIPRTNYPILNIPSAQSKGKTGFSDNVSLGNVSTIQEDNQLVMRIKMENIGQIYIRGITFNSFDGKSWKSTGVNINRSIPISDKKYIHYTAYLEPTNDVYLFTVDIPYRVDLERFTKDYNPFMRNDLSIITMVPVDSRIMYKGISILTDRYPEEMPASYYLLLPSNISERFVKYAKKFYSEDKFNTAINISKELQKLEYSLSNIPQGENPLDIFLFEKKRGNCEYFATAMAIILRINGIPSRVVGGYKTTIYNNIGKYYIVKQKDAHLWVEAYINGFWIRFDPTPSVRNSVINNIERPSKLKLLFDSLSYYYNAFVINYDFSKQQRLYTEVGRRFSHIPNIKLTKDIIVEILSVLLMVILVFFGYYLYVVSSKSYEEKILNLFFSKMKKYGYAKDRNEGLEDFCSKIKDDNLRSRCLNFVVNLQPYIFGRRKMTDKDFKKFKESLDKEV